MKVAIYVRVSTNKQEIESQLGVLRQFCDKQGWAIYKEYVDIISGKEMNRPAFDQMFADAHKLLFDIVLFWALDRFSRVGAPYTIQKLEELTKLKIKYKSYNEPYIDSMGEFKDVILSLLATLAKIERRKISDNTKRAFYIDDKGIVRVKKSKKRVGRPKGRGDKKPRKKGGYYGKRKFKGKEKISKK